MLAPGTIVPSDDASNVKYSLKGFSLQVESVSFGDGSYRAMVDQRMATRKPLMVPFYNWAGFESSTQVTNINQHFTIRTESFDAILATIRPGNYDSTGFNTGNSIGGTPQTAGSAMSNANWFIPQQGGSDPRATSTPILVPEYAVYSWYYTFLSGEKPTLDQFGPNGTFSANYQLNIDSKLYPQFLADVQDAWHMTRNMFDANALALTYGSSVQSLDQFTQAQFLFGVGLDHHSDDAGKDHLISGLNTTGSLIPITFSANFNTADRTWNTNLIKMCGTNLRPTVFNNMTSTPMIYVDRTISIVN